MKDDISQLFEKHRTQLRAPLPQPLEKRVLNTLFPKPSSPSFFRWASLGGGMAAACCALVLSFQLGRMSSEGSDSLSLGDEVVSAHVRSLMVQHLSDVVSTNQHTVKPWFEGKLDFGPTVNDFTQDGFPLVGGRLDYLSGRTTAALVYKSAQHVINVFEYPASGPGTSPRFQTRRGYQIFTWTKDGMRFAAVSDLNATDLQRFVSLW